jgi:hypothetical protein
MGKLKTSSTFYRRGVTNENKNFGFAMQSNWPIIQPIDAYIASVNRPNIFLPSAPFNVNGTAGNSQILLSWSPPKSNGGAPVTKYIINSIPKGLTLNSSTTSVTITGLTNGTPYRFNVIAVTIGGKSQPSTPSPFITPSGIPNPPTNVTGTSGNAEVSLTWTAPVSDGGSPITSYIATSNPGGITATSSTTNVVVTGLTNGTPYTFSVIATNINGNSSPSLASSSVTPSTIPGSPTGVSGTRGNSQVSLTWTAPVSNGGSPITSYTATSNPGGITATSSTTNVVVTGLTNGTPYTFTIVAININGNSSPSIPSAAVTPATIPDPPTNVIASNGPNSGSANVSWTAPVSNGGDTITSYTITSSPDGITLTTSSTSGIVNGLTNGTPYTFNVYATNSVGNSSNSLASNSLTPSSLPSASVWYDPSDISKVTLVSNGVTALTDLTTNGYNGTYISPFVSATYVAPTYNVNPINGLATFRIDNSSANVQTICVPGYNFNDTFISYAIVIRYISGTSGIIATDTPGLFGRGFGCDVSPANGTLQTISYNAFTTWDGTPAPNITIPVNTPSILIASISSGNWIFSLNGTQYTLALTQAKTPDNTNGLNIGCWNPSNSVSIVFDCGEILAYTSFLSSTEIEAVEGYLATKWGLTSSLPPSHPYYST